MNDYRVIDIAVNADLVGAAKISKRDMLSLLGVVWQNKASAGSPKLLQAQTLAIEAADKALELRESGEIARDARLVFRLDPAIDWSTDRAFLEKVRDVISEYGSQRNPSNPQILIYSERYHHKLEILFDRDEVLTSAEPEALLERIRISELTKFITNSGSLYEHGSTAFFATPAGAFHDYFIRIGNTQSLRPFSEATFFWSLPTLKNVKHFFAENWSISTTAATFARMQNTYSGTTSAKWRFGYAYFPSSPEDKSILQDDLDECELRGGRFLLLNSFNSTGNLAKEFSAIASRSRCRNASMMSFFFDSSTASPDHSCLLDIADIIKSRELSGSANLPLPAGAPIFRVDPRTYFPDYRRIKVTKFRFGELSYEKRFFERYSGKGIFSVNRRGRNSPSLKKSVTPGGMRHHAFHIDAERMFADQAFQERLADFLTKRSPATTIVTNGTNASNALAEACVQAIQNSEARVLSCDDPTFLSLLSISDLESIVRDDSERVLVCVPLVISGDTLSNVQIKLREIERNFGSVKCNISIVVGVLRPESPDKLAQLRDIYLLNRENTEKSWIDPVIVESVLLPNWQEDRCPWQREKEFLKSEMLNDDLSDETYFLYSQRINLLTRSQSVGLRGEEVFHTQDDVKLRFNPKSLWLDDNKAEGKIDFLGSKSSETRSNEADLCCAVASALQHWRAVSAKNDWRFNVIDASTVTNLNGFNEARLRASIWRGLTQLELQNTSRTEENNDLEALLEKIFRGDESNENYASLRMEARIAFKSEVERCIGDIPS